VSTKQAIYGHINTEPTTYDHYLRQYSTDTAV